MNGFESPQRDMFPAERPHQVLKGPEEKDPEKTKEKAVRAVARFRPHVNEEDLYVVPPEAIEGGNPDTVIVCLPQDSDRHQEEEFFAVPFRNGEPEGGVSVIRPAKQSMEEVLEKGGKRRYN